MNIDMNNIPEQRADVKRMDASEEEAVYEVTKAPEKIRATEEVANFDELDPCIIDCELRTAQYKS